MHYVRILLCAAVAVLIAQAVGSYFNAPVVQYGILLVAVLAIAAMCRPWYDPESTRAALAEAERRRLEAEVDELRRINAALVQENTRLREHVAEMRAPADSTLTTA